MITTINNEHKKLNAPNLRFPEFQGEWVSKTIGDIAPLQRGFDLPTRQICNGKIPVVYSNGIMNHHSSYKCVAPGLVTGRSGTIGKFTYIEDGYYWPHNTSLWVTDFHDNNPKFIYYLYQTIHIEQYSTGSGVPTLNRNNVHRHKTFIPKLKEQNKIAAFLSLLDERISTQSKIIEDLKKLKSAIINYAINSLDTDFAKFSSLYEMAGEGGTPTTSNASFYDNGKIPFIKIDDLKQKYLTENKDFITELGLQKSSAWLVPTHSILFSNGATIGEISITTYPVCTKQGILGIVPKQNIDVEFLYYFMSSSYFKKAVSRIVTEGTMKTAYLKDINNILCPIPTKEKQQEIAKMPSALNSKIDFEQSILKLFCSQKQYLLRQMFI